MIKLILLFILLSPFSLSAATTPKEGITQENFADEMKYETNFDEAVKKAKKSGKGVMLVLVANYCPWCRKFEQRVLSRGDADEALRKNYVPLILNKEEGKFPKRFLTYFTPVVQFIDYKTLQSHETIVGYNNKEDFFYFIKVKE